MPASTLVFDCKQRFLAFLDEPDMGIKFLWGNQVLDDPWVTLAEVIDSGESSVDNAGLIERLHLTIVIVASVQAVREFLNGRMRPYLLATDNLGQLSFTNHGFPWSTPSRSRNSAHTWQHRAGDMRKAELSLQRAKTKHDLAHVELGITPGSYDSRTSELIRAAGKAKSDLEQLQLCLARDEEALSLLRGTHEERRKHPQSDDIAKACGWVYTHFTAVLDEIDEQEEAYEQDTWQDIVSMQLPPVRLPRVTLPPSTLPRGTFSICNLAWDYVQTAWYGGSSGSAGGATESGEGAVAHLSKSAVPQLLYGLSPEMWRQSPIMRHGISAYLMHTMCCWFAKAAETPDGFIAWSSPQLQSLQPSAKVQLGYLFARYVERRLAKNGRGRKYHSMPVVIRVPLSQFRQHSEDGDAKIAAEVRACREQLLSAAGVEGKDATMRLVHAPAQSQVCFDDNSDLSVFDDSSDSSHDSNTLRQRRWLRKTLHSVSPFVPDSFASLSRMGTPELTALLATVYPAFEITLPTAANANPGGAEGLTALVTYAAWRKLKALRFVIKEVTESHVDNWCVEGDTPIAVIAERDGRSCLDWRRADALRAGDVVAVAGCIHRPARIVATICSEIGAALPMCFVSAKSPESIHASSGVWITHEHPVWEALPTDSVAAAADAASGLTGAADSKRWRPAGELVQPVLKTVKAVYNFVLDQGHVLRAGGTDIVTLAHGFACKELVHSLWGTSACLDALRMARGWPDVTLDSSDSQRLQRLVDNPEIQGPVRGRCHHSDCLDGTRMFAACVKGC
eukprot:gb/GFBE01043143.1/.p1 GENE.gb/GFBE01043143.1/~~gb/GFBE01043143.1/.p1  ORF type:complete len:791 (+),score=104.93 gb/GFBE01043143.1/:1-2373(+)